MSSLQINLDPNSINARIRATEVQLVESGTLNAELRENYMSIYNCRILGLDVEESLIALGQEIATRSRKSRFGVQQIVQFLLVQDPYAQLNQFLPIYPDYYTANGPFWDFELGTPLKWADDGCRPGLLTKYNHWVPPTQWTPPSELPAFTGVTHTQSGIHSSSQSLARNSQTLNPVAAPFMPRGNNAARQTTFQTFKPSRAVLGEPRLLSAELMQRARKAGYFFNENYEGEIDAFAMRNASCPEHQNCSVFVTSVHADVTTQEFFQIITEGPVFSMHMKRPVGTIRHSAISLVFTTREAAEAFGRRAETIGIFMRGLRLKAIWNREKVWPVTLEDMPQSRVLRVTGPDGKITMDAIFAHLRPKINFDYSHKRDWSSQPGMRVYEIGFASVRGQSRPAMRALCIWLKTPSGGNQWRVDYAPDPCDQRPAQLQY